MRIAAITKFKQGTLWGLLKKLGWSQNELSRRTGIGPSQIGCYINLKKKPSKEIADRIQAAFAEAGEAVDVMAIWPESFCGASKSIVIEQMREVDLIECKNSFSLHPSMLPDMDEANKILKMAIKSGHLTKHQEDATMKLLDGETISGLEYANYASAVEKLAKIVKNDVLRDGKNKQDKKMDMGNVRGLIKTAKECIDV